MNIKSLAHVCLKTEDLAKTADFYCGALGFTRVFNFRKNGETIGFYLKASNETFIEVFRAEAVEALGRQVLNHFCLESEDIHALRESLVTKRYEPGEVKLGCDGTLQFWMKDPNGLAVEFQQYTEKSTQFTGCDVEVNW